MDIRNDNEHARASVVYRQTIMRSTLLRLPLVRDLLPVHEVHGRVGHQVKPLTLIANYKSVLALAYSAAVHHISLRARTRFKSQSIIKHSLSAPRTCVAQSCAWRVSARVPRTHTRDRSPEPSTSMPRSRKWLTRFFAKDSEKTSNPSGLKCHSSAHNSSGTCIQCGNVITV